MTYEDDRGERTRAGMEFHLVTGKLCGVHCERCNEPVMLGDGSAQFKRGPGWADLQSKPFVDYYCDPCHTELTTRVTIQRRLRP